MFEQGLAYVLKQFLGEFVEDSGKLQEKLSVGVWSGNIVLENLVLKNEILSVLNLPVALSHGVIGRFELRVPWKKLGVEPVVVIIDGLHILLGPRYEWNPDAKSNREQTLKQAKLAAIELLTNKRMTENPFQGYKNFATKWLMESLVGKLVDNIQVSVTDMHIRYEDQVSCASNFCAGLTIQSLKIQSVEDEFDEMIEMSSNKESSRCTSFQEIVKLADLAVYWNPIHSRGIDACTNAFIGREFAVIETLMARTIARRHHQFIDRPHHHYILQPSDLCCKINIVLDSATADIKISIELSVAVLALQVEDNQLREFLALQANMMSFAKLEESSSYRPDVPVAVDPRAWWRYAIQAVLPKTSKKSLSWEVLKERRGDKTVYVELWRRKLNTAPSVWAAATAAAAAAKKKEKKIRKKTVSVLSFNVTHDVKQSESSTAPSSSSSSSSSSSNRYRYRETPVYLTILDECLSAKAEAEAAAKRPPPLPLPPSRPNPARLRSLKPAPSTLYPTHPPVRFEDHIEVKGVCLDESTAALMIDIENQNSFDDVIFFRSLAEKDLPTSTDAGHRSWLLGFISWASGGAPGQDSSAEKTTYLSTLQNDPPIPTDPTTSSSKPCNMSLNIGLDMGKLSLTIALSTPPSSSSTSSSPVNYLPFLDLSFHELAARAVAHLDGSYVSATLSLQEFEVHEVSPSPIIKNGSMQRVSSAASFSLPHAFSQHFSQDGFEMDRPNHSPCPSVFDTIGANDVRNGFRYTRLISRRVDRDNMPQKRPALKGSNDFFARRSPGNNRNKNKSQTFSMHGVGVGVGPGVNEGSTYKKSNSKCDLNSTFAMAELPAPLLLFELVLCPRGSNTNKQSSTLNEDGDGDSDAREEGSCHFGMEELEVLFSPSAHWIAALGTFCVMPPVNQISPPRDPSPHSLLGMIRSSIDGLLEGAMNSKINFTFDMRIKAPLIMIIISDRNSDILAIDLGFVEIKTGEIRKIPQNGDINKSDSDLGIKRNSMRNDSCDYSVSGLDFNNGSTMKDECVSLYGEDCSYRVISCSLSDIEVSLLSVATDRGTERDRGADRERDRDRDRGRSGGAGLHQSNRNGSYNFSNSNCHLSTNSLNARGARRSRLIDKLDVYMEAQLSEDPWGSDAAPIRIFCEMPVMNIRLSETKMVQLVRFLKAFMRGSDIALSAHYNTAAKVRLAHVEAKEAAEKEKNKDRERKESAQLADRERIEREKEREKYRRREGTAVVSAACTVEAPPHSNDASNITTSTMSISSDYTAYSSKTRSQASKMSNSGSNSSSGSGTEGPVSDAEIQLSSSAVRENAKAGTVHENDEDDKEEEDEEGSECSDGSFESAVDDLSPSFSLPTPLLIKPSNSPLLPSKSFKSRRDIEVEEEALQQVQDLYSLIQHTESVRSQLMSNVRLLECDRSGSKANLLQSLHTELKECEANLHALKIGYVERVLETEESSHGQVGGAERSKESEVIAEGLRVYINALIKPSPLQSEGEGQSTKRRTFDRDSALKIKKNKKNKMQEAAILGNKKLFFFDFNVTQFTITYSLPTACAEGVKVIGSEHPVNSGALRVSSSSLSNAALNQRSSDTRKGQVTSVSNSTSNFNNVHRSSHISNNYFYYGNINSNSNCSVKGNSRAGNAGATSHGGNAGTRYPLSASISRGRSSDSYVDTDMDADGDTEMCSDTHTNSAPTPHTNNSSDSNIFLRLSLSDLQLNASHSLFSSSVWASIGDSKIETYPQPGVNYKGPTPAPSVFMLLSNINNNQVGVGQDCDNPESPVTSIMRFRYEILYGKSDLRHLHSLVVGSDGSKSSSMGGDESALSQLEGISNHTVDLRVGHIGVIIEQQTVAALIRTVNTILSCSPADTADSGNSKSNNKSERNSSSSSSAGASGSIPSPRIVKEGTTSFSPSVAPTRGVKSSPPAIPHPPGKKASGMTDTTDRSEGGMSDSGIRRVDRGDSTILCVGAVDVDDLQLRRIRELPKTHGSNSSLATSLALPPITHGYSSPFVTPPYSPLIPLTTVGNSFVYDAPACNELNPPLSTSCTDTFTIPDCDVTSPPVIDPDLSLPFSTATPTITPTPDRKTKPPPFPDLTVNVSVLGVSICLNEEHLPFVSAEVQEQSYSVRAGRGSLSVTYEVKDFGIYHHHTPDISDQKADLLGEVEGNGSGVEGESSKRINRQGSNNVTDKRGNTGDAYGSPGVSSQSPYVSRESPSCADSNRGKNLIFGHGSDGNFVTIECGVIIGDESEEDGASAGLEMTGRVGGVERPAVAVRVDVQSLQGTMVPSFISSLCSTLLNGFVAQEINNFNRHDQVEVDVDAESEMAREEESPSFHVPTAVPSVPSPSPSPSPSSSSSLDVFLTPLLSLCDCEVALKVRKVDMYVLTAYSTAPLEPSLFSTHTNTGSAALSIQQGVALNVTWGGQCIPLGVRASLAVKGLSLRVSRLTVLSPFTATLNVSAIPSSAVIGYTHGNVASSTEDFNTLEMSVLITPILLNFSETLMQEYLALVDQNTTFLSQISSTRQLNTSTTRREKKSEKKKSNRSDYIEDPPLHRAQLTDFNLKCRIEVQDIGLCVYHKSPVNGPLLYGRRMFLFSVKSIALHGMANSGRDDNNDDDKDTKTSQPKIGIMNGSFTIGKIDFEYFRSSQMGLMKIVTLVPSDNNESAERAFRDNDIRVDIQSSKSGNGIPSCAVLCVEANLSSYKHRNGNSRGTDDVGNCPIQLAVSVSLSDLHVCLLSDAAVQIIHTASNIIHILKKTKSVAHMIIPLGEANFTGATQSLPAYRCTAPLSAFAAVATTDTIYIKIPKPKVILRKSAFSLPYLSNLNISVTVKNLGIWIPTNPENKYETAHFLGFDADAKCLLNSITLKDREGRDDINESEDGQIYDVLGLSAYVNSLNVLMTSPPKELGPEQIPGNCSSDSLSVKQWDKWGNTNDHDDAQSRGMKTVQLITPVRAEMRYSCTLSSSLSSGATLAEPFGCAEQWSILQTLNATISPFEVSLYLDTRPIESIMSKSITPVTTALATLTRSSDRCNQSHMPDPHKKIEIKLDSREKNSKIVERKTVSPNSVFELIGVLGDISPLCVTIAFEEIIVFVVNDLVWQPTSILRCVCQNSSLLIRMDARTSPPSPHTPHLSVPSSSTSATLRLPTATQSLPFSTSTSSSTSFNKIGYLKIQVEISPSVDFYDTTNLLWDSIVEPLPIFFTYSVPLPTSPHNGALCWSLGAAQEKFHDENERRISFAANTNTCDAVEMELTRRIIGRSSKVSSNREGIDRNEPYCGQIVDPPAVIKINLPSPISVNLTIALLQLIMSTIQSMARPSPPPPPSSPPPLSSSLSSPSGMRRDMGLTGGDKSNNSRDAGEKRDTTAWGWRGDAGKDHGQDNGANTFPSDTSVMMLRNDTGLSLCFCHPSVPSTSTSGRFLLPNTVKPLLLPCFETRNQHPRSQPTQNHDYPADQFVVPKMVNISFLRPQEMGGGFLPPVCSIPLQGEGCRLMVVDLSGTKNKSSSGAENDRTFLAKEMTVVAELSSYGGVRTLRLRSTLCVRNITHALMRVVLQCPCVRADIQTNVSRSISAYADNKEGKRKTEDSSSADETRVLWETDLPPFSAVSVPAYLCDVPMSEFRITPMLEARHSTHSESRFSSSVLAVPSMFSLQDKDGISTAKERGRERRSAAQSPCPDDALRHQSNSIRRLTTLSSTGGVDSFSYCHYLRFSNKSVRIGQKANDLHLNVGVECKGNPPLRQKRGSAESLSRVVTFSLPLIIENCLSCDIEVLVVAGKSAPSLFSSPAPILTPHTAHLFAESLTQDRTAYSDSAQLTSLHPGGKQGFFTFSNEEQLNICIKLCGSQAAPSDSMGGKPWGTWSSAVVLKENTNSESRQIRTETVTTYNAELISKNGSVLTVSVDITEKENSRVISFYVPFWVVSSSTLTLQYQHDDTYIRSLSASISDSTSTESNVNGYDQLSPDQTFNEIKKPLSLFNHIFGTATTLGNENNNSDSNTNTSKNQKTDIQSTAKKSENTPMKLNKIPRGFQKSRGLGGIVLGPSSPLAGLGDILGREKGVFGIIRTDSSSPLSDGKVRLKGAVDGALNGEDSNNRGDCAHGGDSNGMWKKEVGSGQVEVEVEVEQNESLLKGKKSNSSSPSSSPSPPVSVSVMMANYSSPTDKQLKLRVRVNVRNQKSKFYPLPSNVLRTECSMTVKYTAQKCDENLAKTVKGKSCMKLHDLGIKTVNLDPPYQRTKMMIVTDKTVFISYLLECFEVKESDREEIVTLSPNQKVPYSWTSNRKIIQIKTKGFNWSGKIDVAKKEEVHIRLRNISDNSVIFVTVKTVKRGIRDYVVIRGSGRSSAPFRIENHTMSTFEFRQSVNKRIFPSAETAVLNVLLPYNACTYCYEEPLNPPSLIVQSLTRTSRADTSPSVLGIFSFEKLGSFNSKLMPNFTVKIIEEGPQRILQIFDTNNSTKSKRNDGHNYNLNGNKEEIEESKTENNDVTTQKINLQILFNLHLLCISVVDDSPAELLLLSFSSISTEYCTSKIEENLDLKIGKIQLDNQLWESPFPSILHPLPILLQNGEICRDPFISFSYKREFRYTSVTILPFVRMCVQPFNVSLEGTIIDKLKLLSFSALEVMSESSGPGPNNVDVYRCTTGSKNSANSNNKKYVSKSSKTDDQYLEMMSGSYTHTSHLSTSDVTDKEMFIANLIKKMFPHESENFNKSTAKIFIEDLSLSDVRFNVTFNPTINKDLNSPLVPLAAAPTQSLIFAALSSLLYAIFSSAARIDNCPLRFNAFKVIKARSGLSDLLGTLLSSYATQAVTQLYLVLGSSDAIGNPVKFIGNLSEGVHDFLYYPAIGLQTSPLAFLSGVVRGTSSLTRRTLSSMCDTAGDLSEALQVGLLALGVVDSSFASQQLQKLTYSPAVSAKVTDGETGGALFGNRKSSSKGMLLSEEARTGTGSSRTARIKPLIDVQSSSAAGRDQGDGDSRAIDSDSLTGGDVWNARDRRPKGMLEGVVQGILGAILEPIAGMQTRGLRGLVEGSTAGVLGLFAKPLYGVLRYTSNTLHGISYRLLPRIEGTDRRHLTRLRNPRFFRSPSLPMQPHRPHTDRGSSLLHSLHQGAYSTEQCLSHSVVKDENGLEKVALLTPARLMVACERFEASDVSWQCLLSDIKLLEIQIGKNPGELSSMHLVTDSPDSVRLGQGRNEIVPTGSNSKMGRYEVTSERRFHKRDMPSGSPVLRLHHTAPRDDRAGKVGRSSGGDGVGGISESGDLGGNERSRRGGRKEKGGEERRKGDKKGAGKGEGGEGRKGGGGRGGGAKQSNRSDPPRDFSSNPSNPLLQRSLHFSSHQDLIQLLIMVLKTCPFLSNSEIEDYFVFCGVSSRDTQYRNTPARSARRTDGRTHFELQFSSKIQEVDECGEPVHAETADRDGKVTEVNVRDRRRRVDNLYGEVDYATGKINITQSLYSPLSNT